MHPLHVRPPRVVTPPPQHFWTVSGQQGNAVLADGLAGQGSGQSRWPRLGQGFCTPKGAEKAQRGGAGTAPCTNVLKALKSHGS